MMPERSRVEGFAKVVNCFKLARTRVSSQLALLANEAARESNRPRKRDEGPSARKVPSALRGLWLALDEARVRYLPPRPRKIR